MKHIILFGPPGSGKGTQARIMADRFNLKHLSTGDLFRYHIQQKNSLGLEAKSYIDQGLLVPDEVTTAMLKATLSIHIKSQGIIYDGYPRTLEQAISFDRLLKVLSLGLINIAFSFSIPENILIKRLFLRGETSNRSDDTDLKVIKNRISEYYKKTSLLSGYYRQNNILIEINAEGSIEEIALLLELKFKELII